MFPVVYEDELYFSFYCRYHERSINKNIKKTIRELELRRINPILPNNIQSFVDNLRIFDIPDSTIIMRKHTPFIYLSNFLSSNRKNELKQFMMIGILNRFSRLERELLIYPSSFKYCSKCAEEDFEKNGESYWKLIDQLPTSYMCLKHNLILNEKIISTEEDFLKTLTISDLENNQDVQVLTNKTIYYLKRFTQQSKYLNLLNINIFNKFNSERLYILLLNRGYIKKKTGEVDVIKLKEDMKDYYGEVLMEFVEFNDEKYEWLNKSPLFIYNKLTYSELLILINYFYDSLSALMRSEIILPNGEAGPFPCLNSFCELFNIRKISYFRLYIESNKITTVFTCEKCGCYYENVIRKLDLKLIDTIIHRTKGWKINVLSLIQKGLNLEKISHKLQISEFEIKRIVNENKYENWIESVDLVYEVPRNWVKRDKQILLYLKSLVSKAIIRGYAKVYMRLMMDVEHIRNELDNLPRTQEYIEKHKSFYENVIYCKN